MWEGKKVIIGVTGSIAAYKTAFLTRLLKKSGAEVQVIMTPASLHFITPLTLSTLSGKPVYSEYYNPKSGEWNNHVELAEWCDLMIIAPASANTLAKMSTGICDNLLLAVYLSARKKVYVAPAMDLEMYQHSTTKNNLKQLEVKGDVIVPAESGELASGLSGEGRMAEPENIMAFIEADLKKSLPLNNKKILVTAGPTHEPIDPVRFIGNRSSGKMGYELAREALNLGAEVTLISGPSKLTPPEGAHVISVESAADIYEACISNYDANDIVIMSAAVADFTPENPTDQKIKKKDAQLNLTLKATKDILKELGAKKSPSKIHVGFALETNDELKNAQDKLAKKNLDMIVLNSLNDRGAGFGHDTNKITVIQKDAETLTYNLKTKREVAVDILNLIQQIILKK